MRSLTQIRRLFRAAILLSILAAIALQTVSAQVRVRGYYRKDGTYVRPHVRTYPDGNPYNNYSFPGNYNPNTGQITPGNPETYLSRYYGRGATTRTLPSSGIAGWCCRAATGPEAVGPRPWSDRWDLRSCLQRGRSELSRRKPLSLRPGIYRQKPSTDSLWPCASWTPGFDLVVP